LQCFVEEASMAHRVVETLIGRLITDEDFRSAFTQDPEAWLLRLKDQGFELSTTEMAALAGTDPAVWARAADGLDPRLRTLVRPAGACV
jgi:hypothetical protein